MRILDYCFTVAVKVFLMSIPVSNYQFFRLVNLDLGEIFIEQALGVLWGSKQDVL